MSVLGPSREQGKLVKPSSAWRKLQKSGGRRLKEEREKKKKKKKKREAGEREEENRFPCPKLKMHLAQISQMHNFLKKKKVNFNILNLRSQHVRSDGSSNIIEMLKAGMPLGEG